MFYHDQLKTEIQVIQQIYSHSPPSRTIARTTICHTTLLYSERIIQYTTRQHGARGCVISSSPNLIFYFLQRGNMISLVFFVFLCFFVFLFFIIGTNMIRLLDFSFIID